MAYVFLDFEASSLSKQSYPIEVGWVGEADEGEAHLIRPAPGWTDWDEEAAGVHGITRERLDREGEAHDAVCARLLDVFATNRVLASAPSWDGHWLSMLLRAAGHPRHLVRLVDSDVAFAEAAAGRGGDIAARVEAAKKAAPPAQHRALQDARREREIWRSLAEGRF